MLVPQMTHEESVPQADGNSESLDSPAWEEIATAAYYLYLGRGHRDGHAIDDWLMAERYLQHERSNGARVLTFPE